MHELAAKPLDAQLLLALYRSMQIVRQTEEELARAHQRGLIHGACHTYVGQEAIAAGVCLQLRTDDVIFSTHRGHGHALAKGVPQGELMAELFGRESGCSRGRGGSMHLFSPERGVMGTSGIVGPCILQACGGGYSFKLLRSGGVAVAFFGDGAVNNGAFHEGLNMASIWKLPVLFVCENNEFATEVPFSYSSGNPSVAARGAAYGMPGVEVDGNDVIAVYRAGEAAIDRARGGAGPTLIECKTYRTRAHAEGMGDFTYRTREAVEAWKQQCPIKRFRAWAIDSNQVSQDALDLIDEETRRQTADARQFAESGGWPTAASATRHVYSEASGSATPRDIRAVTTCKPPRAAAVEGPIVTFAQATLAALREEMSVNPRIFVLGEGIGARGGNFLTTKGLYELFGAERLCDTPICERGFVGLGCGAAMTGARPVIDFMFADFVLDSLGEIINQIAKMQFMSSGRLSMPVLLRGCIGIGHSAATHHSGSYYALFGQVPGLRVVVPSTPFDAKGLLKHALRSNDPVIFLEHRELLQTKGTVPDDDYEIEFGSARLAREGRHATVVALAKMVEHSITASDELAREGVSVEVIDPRTVSPLDSKSILESVQKTGRLLIVDEAPAPYGFGAEVAAQLADMGFDDLDAPIRRLNGALCPTPYSPPLERAIVPGPAEIAAAIRRLLAE